MKGIQPIVKYRLFPIFSFFLLKFKLQKQTAYKRPLKDAGKLFFFSLSLQISVFK